MIYNSPILFPNKSHRKDIIYPDLSEDLAELMGIIFGDGGINNGWQTTIYLNAKTDSEYVFYVSDLIYRLFHIPAKIYYTKRRDVARVVINSTEVVETLIKFGAIKGHKIHGGLSIPSWILSNKTYAIACIRGVFDTDGCTYVDRHQYKNKTYNY